MTSLPNQPISVSHFFQAILGWPPARQKYCALIGLSGRAIAALIGSLQSRSDRF